MHQLYDYHDYAINKKYAGNRQKEVEINQP